MIQASTLTQDMARKAIAKGVEDAIASTVETLTTACSEFGDDQVEERRMVLLQRAKARLRNIRDVQIALLAAVPDCFGH